MFAHERLQVYTNSLDFVAKVAVCATTWDRRHALVDQLSRAAESILSNLAEAARQRGTPARLRTLDYAIGSSLECAACLDVAEIKGLLTREQLDQEKCRVCEVTKMLIGLRKAWERSAAREEPPPYSATSPELRADSGFHHERLAVYQAALAFMNWFVMRSAPEGLSKRLYRQIDEAGTSVVLNIAEGNGRYAELDHRKFIQIADCSAVKAAVYLDLSSKAELMTEQESRGGKEILRQISMLLAGF